MVIVHIVQGLEITHNLTNHSSVLIGPITARFPASCDTLLTNHSSANNASPDACGQTEPDAWRGVKMEILASSTVD